MSKTGVLSANLWAEPHDEALTTLRGITSSFGGKLLLVPVSGYRNVIAHAFCRKYEMLDLADLRARARILSNSLRFDLYEWLRVIECTNRVEHSRLVI